MFQRLVEIFVANHSASLNLYSSHDFWGV